MFSSQISISFEFPPTGQEAQVFVTLKIQESVQYVNMIMYREWIYLITLWVDGWIDRWTDGGMDEQMER